MNVESANEEAVAGATGMQRAATWPQLDFEPLGGQGVLVPRGPRQATRERPPVVTAGATTRPRILIAEDDPDMSSALLHGLRQYGFEPTGVRNGRAILDALDRGNFDALLLDLNLPGLHGCEILSRLRASGAGVPIVVLTGAEKVLVEMAEALGASRVLRKPSLPDQIAGALQAVLEGGDQ